MDPQFVSLLNGLGVPANFIKFVEDKKILDADSFALLASEEKEVKEDIFKMARASNCPLDEIAEQVAVKKLWIACRKIMASGSTPSMSANEDGLPKETDTDLKTHWKSMHGFVLPDSWLLSPQLQRKLWVGANATTPNVEVFLMENLRLLSQRSRASSTSVNLVPGRLLSGTTMEIDMIQNSMEVYMRARAWFMTLAFVSVRNRAWFDVQTAVFASDKIMELVQMTSAGQSPPLSHFICAWAATVNYFSEQVRVTGQPLLTFVKNTGAWEHRWSWSAPAADGRAHHGEDLPRDVAADVNKIKEQARHWQSMIDKQRAEYHKNDKEHGKGKGKGGKNKNKNKDNHSDGGQHEDRHRERSRRR